MEKRAAILEAAKRLFPQRGFDGVSMEAIASDAGVSKLTLYSHFKDKDSLFGEAVRQKCEEQLPAELFLVDPKSPLKKQLRGIAKGFFELIMSEEAIGMNRMLAQPRSSAALAQIFWDAGPRRIQEGFAEFLRAEIEAGQLDIPDPRRAASQFFCLLKGEFHARVMCGCCDPVAPRDVDAHIEATVELFLRAYAPR